LLLVFSLASMILFTLAVGFVQPLTPLASIIERWLTNNHTVFRYCVVLDKNNTGGECKFLVPASEIIRGMKRGGWGQMTVGN